MTTVRKRVLYLGWVGFGNLGDDICRDLFVEHISGIALKEGVDIDVISLFPSRFSQQDLMTLKPDLVVLGGGSLLESPYIEALILAQRHGIPTMIWGSGVDSLRPPATSIFSDSQRTEEQLKLIVDYSGYAGASLLQGVGNCTFGGVRGPDTYTLLQKLGCDLANVQISGDPGLLLSAVAKETPSKSPLSDALSATDDRPVIGINWGTTRNKLYGEDEAKTRDRFAQALNDMSDRYRFIFYAMWQHDLAELQKLTSQVKRSDAVISLDEVPSRAELTALFNRCSFTINLKLHANVFSAAVGCPFISIAYRSKCFDFAHSLKYGQFVIPADAPNLPKAVSDKADKLNHSLEMWRTHLKKQQGRYTKPLRQLLQKAVKTVKASL